MAMRCDLSFQTSSVPFVCVWKTDMLVVLLGGEKLDGFIIFSVCLPVC